jgi:Na+-translocating ferredoxin:NAD+ oxidoreductase subunit G
MKIPRLPAPLGLVLAVLAAAVPAHATEYMTKSELLNRFFAGAKGVSARSITLGDADVTAIGKRLGADLKKSKWSVYVAEDENHKRLGYAVLDQEIGLHELIDYGVLFGLGGSVERVEITVYREPYGDEVRGERFRRQFVGKTANDPIVAGQDIDIVSGASYSSKALALGVKRDTLILQAALKNGL